jgi:hypothetical protein
MQVAAGERDLRVTALQYRGRPAPDNLCRRRTGETSAEEIWRRRGAAMTRSGIDSSQRVTVDEGWGLRNPQRAGQLPGVRRCAPS